MFLFAQFRDSLARHSSMWSALILTTIAVLVGCNVFDVVDGPGSNSERILSAARACLDRGDAECALENYQKLPSDYGEIAASEAAFAELEREGVGIGAFMVGISRGDAGKGITELATRLIGKSGALDRIYESYRAVERIKRNVPLRGFTRFVTALALAAAALAQDGNIQTPSLYTREDLVANPTACLAAGAPACPLTSACDEPAGGLVVEGLAPSPSLINDVTGGALPTSLSGFQGLGVVAGAITAISQALSVELIAGGKFQSGTLNLATAVNAYNPSLDQGRCFRWILLDSRIGQQ